MKYEDIRVGDVLVFADQESLIISKDRKDGGMVCSDPGCTNCPTRPMIGIDLCEDGYHLGCKAENMAKSKRKILNSELLLLTARTKDERLRKMLKDLLKERLETT